MKDDILGKIVKIKWIDSYGVTTGWKDITDYSACELLIESFGKIIYKDDKIISLAHNYADETDNTPMQANGIMVIPLACITEIIYLSCELSCQEIVLEQMPQYSSLI